MEATSAPVLSTPAEHMFDYTKPVDNDATPTKSDQDIYTVYQISQTVRDIRKGSYKCVALQFPDSMLPDAPRVVVLLQKALAAPTQANTTDILGTSLDETAKATLPKLYILADTSYSSCCVDEIAAEHVDADVVVHYGRSCLSPTSRLPVVYVYTESKLDMAAAARAIEEAVPEKETKVVVMADVTYQRYVHDMCNEAHDLGYKAALATEIERNPLSPIPNRRIVTLDGITAEFGEGTVCGELNDWEVFHLGDPPTALLLALSSRVKAFHVLPTPSPDGTLSATPVQRNTRALLGRRYARVITVATAGVIGILINTLSVKNYLESITALKEKIASAEKKSYTVVVGKLNPAKLSNFAEIDGWVVVGCWESSLVEEDGAGGLGYYKPVVTPFELEVALQSDEERVWGAEWWSGIESISRDHKHEAKNGDESAFAPSSVRAAASEDREDEKQVELDDQVISDEESLPPEFDLRTGKLVHRSRPMRKTAHTPSSESQLDSAMAKDATPRSELVRRPKHDLTTVKGVLSPGAEYLRSQRIWQGLGSDFAEEADTSITEGRSGIARGYTVGDDVSKT